jgi:hypothetical protein
MRFIRMGVIGLALAAAQAAGSCSATREPLPARAGSGAQFVGLPLAFVPNEGQADARARFVAHGRGATVFVCDDAAVLAARGGSLRIRPVGTQGPAVPVAESPLPGYANYFLGRDPARWRTRLPTFARAVNRGVYPGIDWVLRGAGSCLEYDFVVAPGADPTCIRVEFDGARSLAIDARGDLRIATAGGEVVQRRPVCWQEADGGRRPVAGRYRIESDRCVSFELGPHDASLALVIDPIVDYGTYFGGATGSEQIRAVTRDAAGNLYLLGTTNSTDFPLVGAWDDTYAGAGGYGVGDGFVAKLSPDATEVLFSTYVGGRDDDGPNSIVVNPLGGVFFAGGTLSNDYPTTAGSLQQSRAGGWDGFVSWLSSDGATLLASTYLGGQLNDYVDALAVDAAGAVLATGDTGGGIPGTAGVVQPDHAPDGGNTDAFLCRFGNGLAQLSTFTYLGGNQFDRGLAIALAPGGDVILTGFTSSTDFPVVNAAQGSFAGGAYDMFLARLDPAATQLRYSIWFGGTGTDSGTALLVDGAGGVTVAGETDSDGLATAGAFQSSPAEGLDTFVARFSPVGALLSFSYLGGNGVDTPVDLALGSDGSTWIGGTTTSTDFPVRRAEQPRSPGGSNGFVARLPSDASEVEYASYVGGSGDESVVGFILSDDDVPYVAGSTTSAGLQTSPDAPQREYAGEGDGFLATPHPDILDSSFLPRKVAVTPNRNPAKTKLVAQGYLDTGIQPVDLAAAAEITVGSLVVEVPGLTPSADGKKFTWSGPGISFRVERNPYGSSRAKFFLSRTGDLAGLVPTDGPVLFRYRNGLMDGRCTVVLKKGGFRLLRTRGSLLEPNLFVVRSTATVKGGGRDALNLYVGLATGGTVPDAASDVTLTFGNTFQAEVPASGFRRKGSQWVFRGDANGVRTVVLDYARDVAFVQGSRMDLGPFVPGANPMTIVVGVGDDVRGVSVTASRVGNALKY